MTILVRYFPANLTTEQYNEVLRRLEEDGPFPDAAMDLHISYGQEGNLRVSEIWDSAEQMQAFGEKLMPILADVGIEMAAEPEVIEIRNSVNR
jgi:hypothetical protein